MKLLKGKLALCTTIMLLTTIFSNEALAVWLNVKGKVTSIYTYASRETIIVSLDNVGANVAECSNKTAFAISKSISAEARSRMYSLLLAAHSANREVTIAFNDVGGCEPWDANASAYRRIARVNNN